MPRRFFFYASLRRGQINFEKFQREWPGGLKEIASGYITGAALVNMGDYPSLIPADQNSRVFGEVYEVSDAVFEHVERHEAEANYRKHPVEVHTGSNLGVIQAEAYAYADPDQIKGRPRVDGGDWSRAKGQL